LRDGLKLLRSLLERYWDNIYPLIDEDGDAIERSSILTYLRDYDFMLRDVRAIPLVSSPVLGRFSMRSIDIAEGRLKPMGGDEKPVDRATINAAFMDCDIAELQAAAGALSDGIEELEGVSDFLNAQLGIGQAPDLKPLADDLNRMAGEISVHLAERGGGEPEATVVPTPQGGGSPAPRPAVAARGGEIASREDVIQALDGICAYYERHEPSSPVPILMKRARKLVMMSFMDIIRNLAPSGVQEVELIRGVEEEESSSEDGASGEETTSGGRSSPW
jgi:type VI secretion system protein ImpA